MEQEKLKLRLGLMSTREIAEWMGVTYGTFRVNSKKRLEQLKYFADFTIKKNKGVFIEKIYLDVYDKGVSIDDERVYDFVRNAPGSLSTVSGVRRQLKQNYTEYRHLSDSWVDKRVEAVLMRQFNKKESLEGGSKGYRKTKWAIKVSDLNEYREMTEEEEKLFKKLVGGYFNKNPEIIIKRDELETDLKEGYLDKDAESAYQMLLREIVIIAICYWVILVKKNGGRLRKRI